MRLGDSRVDVDDELGCWLLAPVVSVVVELVRECDAVEDMEMNVEEGESQGTRTRQATCVHSKMIFSQVFRSA